MTLTQILVCFGIPAVLIVVSSFLPDVRPTKAEDVAAKLAKRGRL